MLPKQQKLIIQRVFALSRIWYCQFSVWRFLFNDLEFIFFYTLRLVFIFFTFIYLYWFPRSANYRIFSMIHCLPYCNIRVRYFSFLLLYLFKVKADNLFHIFNYLSHLLIKCKQQKRERERWHIVYTHTRMKKKMLFRIIFLVPKCLLFHVQFNILETRVHLHTNDDAI